MILLAALPCAALEIPLERGASKSSHRGVTLGFVDMERIYKDFPETKQAQKDYQDQADKLKQALSDKEAELSDLREQLSVLKAAAEETPPAAADVSASSAPAVSSSTAAVKISSATLVGRTPDTLTAITGSLSEKERVLAQEEDALARSRKEAAVALAEFERQRAAQIFGKLYKSLVQLADEKGIDMIVDKQSLLYGQQALDLTDLLSRRVRGLPDAEEDGK